MRLYRDCIKRGIDVVVSLMAVIILSPVFLIVSVLVRTKLGSPVIFKQERPGKDEKIFCMYKFRTMTDEKDVDGNLLPDEKRLTPFGKKLRDTSLDELPELFNIIKGDMSIVGPRPLLVRYLPLYNDRQKRRHEVKPGITGLAQVKGRNSISWEKKFEWDVRYVEHVSFLLDLKIVLDTIGVVLKKEGISSDTSVTMEEFRGTKDKMYGEKMKTILILGNNDQGLYKFRREIIQELLNKKYNVIISTPYGEYIPILERMGCQYIALEYNRAGKNPFDELKLIKGYADMIKEVRCDAVLLYTIKPTLYAGLVCRIRKIPYVVNITGLSPALTTSAMLRNICFALYRLILKKADIVFFQNREHLKLFLKMKAVGNNYKLIPGSGVNLKEYTYQQYSEDKKLRILYIGRITKVKGIDELLQAIKILNHESNDFIFEFVGECDEQYREKIERLHKKKQIIYYGVCASSHEHIKNAHTVIMPSYGEGMSNVLLEASAIGRPILASNVSGCKEILKEGITGFGFEPHSVEGIITAIKRFQKLTAEEREKMGMAGRKHVEKSFSREIVIKSYMEQIDKICKENRDGTL